MSEWWEKPYPGGAMVPVPGFPRSLYFPGNPAGKPVSEDGPDVMAYKRGCSRLGRWPWTPADWDYTYSKNFALGKPGGNVGDSGVIGMQRQQPELGESGQFGEATFNFMRAARIPDGLPNAGLPAFDATALNLIGEAWQIFKGKDTPAPPPPPALTVRQRALKTAISQLGVKESPRNSNRVKYSDWYGIVGPWCAMFVTWCYETNGNASPSFVRGSRYAYCPFVVNDAQNGRYGLSLTSSPIPGDLVVYDWDGGTYDHIGIFERGNGSSWSAIEGNTSLGNNSNGGEVMRRDRRRNQMQRVAFVRVREP